MSNSITCGRCKQLKPVNEFHKDKATKTGYHSNCKKCRTDKDYSTLNTLHKQEKRKHLFRKLVKTRLEESYSTLFKKVSKELGISQAALLRKLIADDLYSKYEICPNKGIIKKKPTK